MYYFVPKIPDVPPYCVHLYRDDVYMCINPSFCQSSPHRVLGSLYRRGMTKISVASSFCSLGDGVVPPNPFPTLTHHPSQGGNVAPILSAANRIFREIVLLGGSHNSSSPPRGTVLVPVNVISCEFICEAQ